MKTIVHDSPTAGVLESLAYDYNPSGTIQDMTDHNGLHVFGYDRTYQLTSVDYPSASPFPDITYNYDGAGNRTSTVTAAGTVTYVANALNEYTSVGAVTQTYDLNGNLTSDGTNTYTFDAENRLVSATTPTGSVTYAYDPFMRRVRKTLASESTYSVWTRDYALASYDGGALSQRLVRDGSPIPIQIAYASSVALFDVLADQLYAPRTVSDAATARVWRASYEVFGRFAVDSGSSVSLEIRFPGQVTDMDTGLINNRYRYYSGHTGRYLTQDPLGQGAGINTYSYVLNSPTLFADIDGLDIAIIENGKTEGNPFGHTAGASTGSGVYSEGNNTPPGSSLSDYLRRESPRRDTTVTVIPTTPSQDKAFADALRASYGKPLGKATNNCSSHVNAALDAAGIPDTWPPNNLPGSAGDRAAAAGGMSQEIPQGSGGSGVGLEQFEPGASRHGGATGSWAHGASGKW